MEHFKQIQVKYFILITAIFFNNLQCFAQNNLFSEKSIGYDEDPEVGLLVFKDLKKRAKESSYYLMLLGDAYRKGVNVETNLKKAVKTYSKASEMGDDLATHRLAFMYKNGQGVTKDSNKFISLLEDCAKYGNLECNHDLGVLYYYGEIVTQNYKKSHHHLLKIHDGNYATKRVANANYLLGQIYNSDQAYEQGFEISLAKAIHHFTLTGEKGDEEISDIKDHFKDLAKLKFQVNRANTYLPNVNVDINYKDFNEVNTLIQQIRDVKLYIGVGNQQRIEKELARNIAHHHLHKSYYDRIHSRFFIQQFDKYDWLQALKLENAIKLEKRFMQNADLNDVTGLNNYLKLLKERESLYTITELNTLNEAVKNTFNDLLTTPTSLLVYNEYLKKEMVLITTTQNFSNKIDNAFIEYSKKKLEILEIPNTQEALIDLIKNGDKENIALFYDAGYSGHTEVTFGEYNGKNLLGVAIACDNVESYNLLKGLDATGKVIKYNSWDSFLESVFSSLDGEENYEMTGEAHEIKESKEFNYSSKQIERGLQTYDSNNDIPIYIACDNNAVNVLRLILNDYKPNSEVLNKCIYKSIASNCTNCLDTLFQCSSNYDYFKYLEEISMTDNDSIYHYLT
ncbi:MAG: sel1 repeat family protein, partial [Flavobacteriales bacterium]|nr:sel1 repeat family protein [Flavobacteriales bacterium]